MSDVPVVLNCSNCGSDAAQETVTEMGIRHHQPGCSVMTVNLWSPATNKCQHCVAKPAFLGVKLSDLESATLPRSAITKEAVFWAMHLCELNCLKNITKQFEGRPSVDALRLQMGHLILERYSGAQGARANMELAGKIKELLFRMDKIPHVLPTRSKMNVECVDGIASYSLTTILCLFDMPKKNEENQAQGNASE